MDNETKKQIEEAMNKIAQRRPGRRRLVYDRATRTILTIDRHGLKEKIYGLTITPEEGHFFD